MAVTGLFFVFSCEQEEIECLRVSGEADTLEWAVGDFNKVFFNDVGNLHISQGNETRLIFVGQPVILENLIVAVNEGELMVSLGQCFNGDDYQLDIFVTTPKLTQLKMAGAGKVITTNQIVSDDITLILSGVTGKFKFDVQADSISTIFSGQGNIDYSGLANKHRILLSGAGNINAYDLDVKAAEISITGPGDAFVKVNESLKATLSSSGNVFYRGDPSIAKEEYGEGKVVNDN